MQEKKQTTLCRTDTEHVHLLWSGLQVRQRPVEIFVFMSWDKQIIFMYFVHIQSVEHAVELSSSGTCVTLKVSSPEKVQ